MKSHFLRLLALSAFMQPLIGFAHTASEPTAESSVMVDYYFEHEAQDSHNIRALYQRDSALSGKALFFLHGSDQINVLASSGEPLQPVSAQVSAKESGHAHQIYPLEAKSTKLTFKVAAKPHRPAFVFHIKKTFEAGQTYHLDLVHCYPDAATDTVFDLAQEAKLCMHWYKNGHLTNHQNHFDPKFPPHNAVFEI